MATEPTKVDIIIQDKVAQGKTLVTASNVVVDVSTGETLDHRLQNLDIVKYNLDQVIKQVRKNISDIDATGKEIDELREDISDFEQRTNQAYTDFTSRVESVVAQHKELTDNEITTFEVKINNDIAAFIQECNQKIAAIPVVTPSSINGNIRINNAEVTVYTPDKAISRYGTTIPNDLKDGEVFMLLLSED